jgi:DNA (cytosine-5)-methyltransferase 1
LDALPRWKADFLIKNARFYDDHREIIRSWRKANPAFATFPHSRRQLEWQAQDTGSLWETVMHFRPSGIRAKAPTYLPALVAITQTSVVGSRGRRLTPHEAARLQGLPRSFQFANSREAASYKQVGNGVAAGAAWHVLREHVQQNKHDLPIRVASAILDADPNPCPDALSPAAYAFEEQLLEKKTATPIYLRSSESAKVHWSVWSSKTGAASRSKLERSMAAHAIQRNSLRRSLSNPLTHISSQVP